jgi:hypothetical protein
MSLSTLQRAFQAHILTGDNAIVELVDPAMRRGLRVYHYAYRASLRETLRDTFQKTVLWLGDEVFDEAANMYVAQTPSTSWTMADYGAGFADALAISFGADPEVGEIAWLDWSLRHAFAAGALAGPDAAQLAAVDWESVRLTLAPHVAFRRIETNVIDVWNSLPEAHVAAHQLDEPTGLVVWRNDLMPEFRSAELVEIDALECIAADPSFAEMCSSLAEMRSVGADVIGALLGRWLGDAMVAVVR